MTGFNNDSILVRVSLIFGLAFSTLITAQTAEAALTDVFTPCLGSFGSPGCAPFSEFKFSSGTGGPGNVIFLYEYDNTAFDHSAAGANGVASARGAVDLATATLKVLINSAALPGGQILVSGTDVFTLLGPPGGGFAPVTAVLTADGVGIIDRFGDSAGASVMVGTPGGGQAHSDTASFFAGQNAPVGVEFPIHLVTSASGSVQIGSPFQLSFVLISSAGGISAAVDFLNTAQLSFILPAGMSITSLGGFSAAPVPLPTALILLGSGLAGVRLWGRKSQGRISALFGGI